VLLHINEQDDSWILILAYRNRTALLQKPVRVAVIGKYLGQLLAVLAILMLLPLLVSLVFNEFEFTVCFVVVEILLLSAGLQTNEGLVISALVLVYPARWINKGFNG